MNKIMHSFKGNTKVRGHIPFKYLVVDSVLDGPFEVLKDLVVNEIINQLTDLLSP